LIDLRGPEGPFWELYQEARKRDGIADNPDFVPGWFMARIARERVGAARVAVEQLDYESTTGWTTEHGEVWRALCVIERAIRQGTVLSPMIEQMVAGLLGAGELD
jgi:hypothetical protein